MNCMISFLARTNRAKNPSIPANLTGSVKLLPIICIVGAMLARMNDEQRVRNMKRVLRHTCKLDWLSMARSFLLLAMAPDTIEKPWSIRLCPMMRKPTSAMIMKKLVISLKGSPRDMPAGTSISLRAI